MGTRGKGHHHYSHALLPGGGCRKGTLRAPVEGDSGLSGDSQIGAMRHKEILSGGRGCSTPVPRSHVRSSKPERGGPEQEAVGGSVPVPSSDVRSRNPRREKGMLNASSRRDTEAAVTARCFRDDGPIRSLQRWIVHAGAFHSLWNS